MLWRECLPVTLVVPCSQLREGFSFLILVFYEFGQAHATAYV